MPNLTETWSYIKNFLRDRDVAAIAPSSRYLVRRVCKWIDFDKPATIVEYGPGNGVFSEYIRARMSPDSTLLLIESNPDFARTLTKRMAGDTRVQVVEGRAQDVSDILDGRDIAPVDYVVSGIPFSFLDDDETHALLNRTRRVLADDGEFLVYQNYNHMEAPLRAHFSEVEKEYEPRNFPPTMFAYRARK